MDYRNKFSVTCRNNVVTVSKNGVSPENFDKELSNAHNILRYFHPSKAGSTWGCDGVGYALQKALGVVEVHKSGVGPMKFQQGMADYKASAIQLLKK